MSTSNAQLAMPPEPGLREPKLPTGWILLAILSIAIALRLPGYTESVWIDELFTSNLFCGDPIILLKTLYSDIHPPAYFVFIHFWNGIFGDAEVWLRLPPMLFGLGTIVCVWRLGVLFRSNATGLIAAALLALSPVHIWYSQEARPYAASMFATALTVLTYYRLVQGRKGFWLTTTFLLSLTCMVFTHYYLMSFACVFTGLAIVQKTPNRRRILVINLLVLGLLGAYMGAKIYFSHVPLSKSYLRGFDLQAAWDLFRWFVTGDSFGRPGARAPWGDACVIAILALGMLALARGVWQLSRHRGAEHAPHGLFLVLQMLVLPAFLIALNLVGLNETYIERSALPAMPFFVLIVATGLTGFRSAWLGRAALGGAAIVTASLLIAFFSRGAEEWTVYKPNPDWRSAATFLGAELDADGSAGRVTLYSQYESPTGLTYYDPRMQEIKNFEPNTRRIEQLLGKTTSIFGTEGFPGGMIQDIVKQRLTAFQQLMETTAAGTRLGIEYLATPATALAEDGPREFWLLRHGWPGPPDGNVKKVLDDARTTLLLEQRFLALTLYKVKRAD